VSPAAEKVATFSLPPQERDLSFHKSIHYGNKNFIQVRFRREMKEHTAEAIVTGLGIEAEGDFRRERKTYSHGPEYQLRY
ncbi:hypothetical protein NPIL_367401, partial [Nephila pilipes]